MRVYHLLKAEHALNDIRQRRIRISRFSDLNDPFELLAAKTDERGFRRAIRAWRTQISEIYGLLCFSSKWESPVLWSHYADKHRGMCLGFDLADTLVERVNYLADRIPVRFADNGSQLDEDFVRQLLRTKYVHWKYEDEVRAFIRLDHKTAENGSYYYDFDVSLQLREVVLGPFCETPIADVRRLVRETYESVSVIKSRLAFKWFTVVSDERSVHEENEYWLSKQSPAGQVV